MLSCPMIKHSVFYSKVIWGSVRRRVDATRPVHIITRAVYLETHIENHPTTPAEVIPITYLLDHLKYIIACLRLVVCTYLQYLIIMLFLSMVFPLYQY